MLSDGGLISSASDMAKYAAMLLDGGHSGKCELVGPDSIKGMMEPKVLIPEYPLEGEGRIHYGYGLRIKTDFLGRRLVYHSGSVYVSTAYLGVIPEEDMGVVVLANGSGYFLEYVGEHTLATVLGEDPMEIPSLRRERALEDLTGVYETYEGMMNFKVTRRGGLLNIEIVFGRSGSFNVPLIPVDLDGETKTFDAITVDSRMPVEFFDKEGGRYMIYDRYKLKKASKI